MSSSKPTKETTKSFIIFSGSVVLALVSVLLEGTSLQSSQRVLLWVAFLIVVTETVTLFAPILSEKVSAIESDLMKEPHLPHLLIAQFSQPKYLHYLIHSENQPAVVFWSGLKIWAHRGLLHREDGPAVEKKGKKRREGWFWEGIETTQPQLCQEAVRNDLTEEQYEKLVECDDYVVRKIVLNNPHCPDELKVVPMLHPHPDRHIRYIFNGETGKNECAMLSNVDKLFRESAVRYGKRFFSFNTR